MAGKGEGIVIAPHVAGHLLGGTVGKITKDGEYVIYAVDFNHRKERHLNETVLESFVQPAFLITDAYNALNNQPSRRQWDQEFLADGNVLLPVDIAGRILELILILEQYWAQHHLTYPIYFLTYVSSSTIDYVKSFLEWMSYSIAKSFEHTHDNAFLLKHITLLISKSELENVPEGTKIVLASMASLEAGFSQDIFVEWASDVKNCILFTEKGQFATLARMLQSDLPPKAVKVTMSKRVPLVGDELAAYEEAQNRKKQQEALKATLIKEEESKAVIGAELPAGDPMVIDCTISRASADALQSRGIETTTECPFCRQRNEDDVHVLVNCSHPQAVWSVSATGSLQEESVSMADWWNRLKRHTSLAQAEYSAMVVWALWQKRNDHIWNNKSTSPSDVIHQATQLLEDWNNANSKDLKSTPEPLDRPNKWCSPVQLKSSLSYMDFEGRSIKSILARRSLKAGLVHGSAEATEHLKQHCLKHVCPMYAPKIEETIDVTLDLCAYKVQLSEKLMSNVLFKKLGDYEIAWVDSEVGKTESGILSLLPLWTPAPPHKSVLVGDIKMADFKQFLAGKGIQVEFSGGALRCGEHVTLRKVGDASQKGAAAAIQQIVIEGPLSEEYYMIREYLYSQFYSL
ncbi:hypothetical protein LguiA_024079 [Lonicera macranthoides]